MFNDWTQKGCTLSKLAVAKTELILFNICVYV